VGREASIASGATLNEEKVMWSPSSAWTPQDRLTLIALLARYIRDRTMRWLPYNEIGTPNAEAIRAVAEEPAELLEANRESVEELLRQMRTDWDNGL
jgi:hypothetical protein